VGLGLDDLGPVRRGVGPHSLGGTLNLFLLFNFSNNLKALVFKNTNHNLT
jgi:hypothetical protein